MELNQENIINVLQEIKYPPKEQDIISLKMVTKLEIEEKTISFTLLFDKHKDPFEGSIKNMAMELLIEAFGNDIEVKIRAIGKVDIKNMEIKSAPQKPKKSLPNVKNIIMVTSGKGGVGKSTVAVNLSIALAKTGASVGILDSDMWGPSIPGLFDIEDAHPKAKMVDGKNHIEPIEKYGVKIISLGLFVDKNEAIIWRGSMVTNALKQLMDDVYWGELDYMVIDLPPGTGDTQITMAQSVESAYGVVVSTPQTIAINDVRKAVNMFQSKGIDVPVLGIVENMAWFTPDELPDNKYYIFGKEGAKLLAAEFEVPLLGEIPIIEKIRMDGDSGTPSALDENSLQGKAFKEIAQNVIAQIEKIKSVKA